MSGYFDGTLLVGRTVPTMVVSTLSYAYVTPYKDVERSKVYANSGSQKLRGIPGTILSPTGVSISVFCNGYYFRSLDRSRNDVSENHKIKPDCIIKFI